MMVLMAVLDDTLTKEFIPGVRSHSPRCVTGIPDEWRSKLEATDPDRNVRIVECDEVVFQGTAAELLGQLEP